ncbi:MAG: hypothetical protein MZW92_12915 [Comamonadaceae bacterium]|nr:hypothetical protein [Comamonadaceae bacterium]
MIPPGIDVTQYGGYSGDQAGVLQVCNHLQERGAMLGWEMHQSLCQDLPSLVLGLNARIPGSRQSESLDDLKEQYRRWRVYLYTAVHPYEDGYNLPLLEAMATGMPVATVSNPTSPVASWHRGCCRGYRD